MSRRQRIPTYRLHKQSGQAIVTLTDGLGSRRDVLLGQHGTDESEAEYLRVITEWKAAGRRLPPRNTQTPDLTVSELALAYWRHAESYYVKNGEPTKQLSRIKLSLRPLKELYGHTPAREFGPLALKAVRERMLDMPCGHCRGAGQRRKPRRLNRRNGHTGTVCKRCGGSGRVSWTRKLINAAIGCLKRMFKWGVAEELVPADIYHGLQAVEGLKKGRSAAKETKPIRPVTLEHVEAVLPLLMSPVRAMVQLEMLTGMRPGEVIIMRPCDIDRATGKTWIYRPDSHKTEHHDIARVVFLGPKAQAILAPFLNRDPGAYCFSPQEAMAEFRQLQRQNRKSKVQPSQQDRSKRKPRKQPGECYSVDTYGNAIERACLRANIPAWHPNQLRHSKATEIRREHGLDAARAVLGHRTPTITEVYAEIDAEKAAAVMEKLG